MSHADSHIFISSMFISLEYFLAILMQCLLPLAAP